MFHTSIFSYLYLFHLQSLLFLYLRRSCQVFPQHLSCLFVASVLLFVALTVIFKLLIFHFKYSGIFKLFQHAYSHSEIIY